MLNKQQRSLKAGEYLIPAHASMHDIMDTMVTGRGILYSVTIPEGLTSQQIVERLMGDDVLVGDVTEVPPEGTLLPDTYKFTRGDTRQDLIDRMRRERDRSWPTSGAAARPICRSRRRSELVVLASIVEKETSLADERSRVAAVFINRLRLNMRLQSDPTVIYALVQGRRQAAQASRSAARISTPTSPYNTYVVDGLPPGPIANPGRASLEAVANPSRTRDLFFVADGNGGHAFAETYEAHLRNVARWREVNKNAASATPAMMPRRAPTARPLRPPPRRQRRARSPPQQRQRRHPQTRTHRWHFRRPPRRPPTVPCSFSRASARDSRAAELNTLRPGLMASACWRRLLRDTKLRPMPVFSMTGFARRDGGGEGYRWTWELRSVNGKGLDIRLRLPPGFEYIEMRGT